MPFLRFASPPLVLQAVSFHRVSSCRLLPPSLLPNPTLGNERLLDRGSPNYRWQWGRGPRTRRARAGGQIRRIPKEEAHAYPFSIGICLARRLGNAVLLCVCASSVIPSIVSGWISKWRRGGGIEPLHVSMPRELKSRPSTSPTHPGCLQFCSRFFVIAPFGYFTAMRVVLPMCRSRSAADVDKTYHFLN